MTFPLIFIVLQKLRTASKKLKRQSILLYYIYKDGEFSLWKKMFFSLVIGYIFSPIDLIPDFIPILGFIDDLLLVPLGIFLALKLISIDQINKAKAKIEIEGINEIPLGRKTGLFIIFLWITGCIAIIYWILIYF